MPPPRLHTCLPELTSTLSHVSLGTGPTQVRQVPGLSTGPAEVWVKNEGAFGDGDWGGNKVRKLEWLIPEAKRRGRRTLFSVGGIGTHWGLAAALYGREQGLHTALALVDQPVDDHVREQLARLRASGASLHMTHTKARTIALAPYLLLRHSTGLRPPYYVPAGGSSPVGAVGYVEAGLEIGEQVRAGDFPEPGHVVVPVGSGGTVAGLLVGLTLAGLATRVTAIVVNDQLRLDAAALVGLALTTTALLRDRGADLTTVGLDEESFRERLKVSTDWLGEAYGAPTDAGRAALVRGEAEGIAMEPVYTAKALAALLALNGSGRLGTRPVLFLGTHGPR